MGAGSQSPERRPAGENLDGPDGGKRTEEASRGLTATVKTRVDQDWKEALRQIAGDECRTVSDIVRRALALFIEQRAI
jgi:hypothetical protein